MNFHNMSMSDVSRKLAGYCRVNGQVFQLLDLGDDYMFGNALTSCGTWEEHRTSFANAVIDTTFPDMGYVNYKSGIVYCIRKAVRQWSVVYNHGVVEVRDPQRDLRAMLNLRVDDAVSSNPAFVKRLFNRHWYSYEEAIASLRSGKRIAAALNRNVAIAQSAALEGKYIIYYKNKVVGWVDVGDTPILFREADYVAAACPFNVMIEDVQ